MSLKDKMLYRFDRILLVVIVIIGCSSGMVALVSSPEVLSEPPVRLSFPEPLQKVVGYDVPTKKLAVSVAVEKEEKEYTVQETQKEEFVEENVPLGSLLPCSCCKKTSNYTIYLCIKPHGS